MKKINEMMSPAIETDNSDSIRDDEDIVLDNDLQNDLDLDQEVKIKINNGTVEVIQIQEESDHEEEADGRLINEEIIARYNNRKD